MKRFVRPIALTAIAPVPGFLILQIARMLLGVHVSKPIASTANLVLLAVVVLYVFPRVLGLPFGRIGARAFVRRVGLTFPAGGWRHLLLGIVCAACTLGGMLIGSLLTGKYHPDWNTVTASHALFSLNPAFGEEIFYRGVQMLLLLGMTRSLKKAFALQVAIFGFMHWKGIDAIAFVEIVSVMILAVGFTYVVYKTRSLVAAIVFHYLHDTFLFLAQLPEDGFTRLTDHVFFYAGLWTMVAVACFITKAAAERLGVRSGEPSSDDPRAQWTDALAPVSGSGGSEQSGS